MSSAEAARNLNTGHGHVRPRPDGMKARCGGPVLCPDCARDLAQDGKGVLTGLRLHEGEPWDVFPDMRPDPDDTELTIYARRRCTAAASGCLWPGCGGSAGSTRTAASGPRSRRRRIRRRVADSVADRPWGA